VHRPFVICPATDFGALPVAEHQFRYPNNDFGRHGGTRHNRLGAGPITAGTMKPIAASAT